MALINRPMYEHFGARHLGVKGPGALTNLEEGVMGVLPLDLMSDPAYWYIQGIRCFGMEIDKAAGGAGNYSNAGLSIEDTDAEILTKVIAFWVNEPYSDQQISIWRCARTAFSSDPGVNGYSTDTRVDEAQQAQTVGIGNNNGSATPGTRLFTFRQTTMFDQFPDDVPLVISPGQSIYFHNETANARLDVMVVFAEIPAYKAEL